MYRLLPFLRVRWCTVAQAVEVDGALFGGDDDDEDDDDDSDFELDDDEEDDDDDDDV